MPARSRKSIDKENAFYLIKAGDIRSFKNHLGTRTVSPGSNNPSSSKSSILYGPQDIQDFFNHALCHGKVGVIDYLLDEEYHAAWPNLLVPKELFYIYATKRRHIHMEELHNFDEIFAQFDRLNQKIKELKSSGEQAAVNEASELLFRLQKEVIELMELEFSPRNITIYITNCTNLINNALQTPLAKQKGWKVFLHGLIKYITLGTFHLIGKGEWYHPKTESQQVIEDTKKALISWKNKTETKPETEVSEDKVARRMLKADLLQGIKTDNKTKFSGEFYSASGKKINLEDEPQDFQDVLNQALAYGRKELVHQLMERLPERPTGSSPLIRQPILISKELFYIYTPPQQELSDEDIHSFDKMFEMIDIIHHKIIEWKSQQLSPSDGKHDLIEFSVHLIHNMEKELIKFAHRKQDINALKQHCKGFLKAYSQCTFVTEGWGDVLHKLKLTVFGHSKIGANRFALYTPKDIIRETDKALEQVQCTA